VAQVVVGLCGSAASVVPEKLLQRPLTTDRLNRRQLLYWKAGVAVATCGCGTAAWVVGG
jgi:hypothetical protein